MSDPSGKVTLSLGDVAAEIYASLDPATTIAAITRAAIGALGADRATTYVTDEAGLITEVHTTEDDPRVRSFIDRSVGRPMEEMPVWAALGAQRDPVMLVEDVATTLGQEFADHIRVTSFAGVRLERQDGAEFLGGIFCSFRASHEFTEDERGAVRTLGALASLALSNARLFQRTDRDMQEARAFAEAQRAFRLLAENSSDVISRSDANGVIGYISPASLRVLEISPGDAIGRSLPALLGLDSVAELTTGETVISRLPRDDAEMWVETSAHRVGDPLSGDPVEIHASTRDVTSRQRAREQLRSVAAEQAALRRVTSCAAEGAGESETWEAFTRELGTLVDATGTWVLRADGDQAEVVAAWSAGTGGPQEGQVLPPRSWGRSARPSPAARPRTGGSSWTGRPCAARPGASR